MNEQSGLSDQYRRASPWPLFVALGLTFSEVGVFIGILPVAVFGLILFGGSVAGILTESGYAERPWTAMLAIGGALLVAGAAVVLWQAPLSTISLAEFGTDGILARGLSVAVGGAILVAVAVAAKVAEQSKA